MLATDTPDAAQLLNFLHGIYHPLQNIPLQIVSSSFIRLVEAYTINLGQQSHPVLPSVVVESVGSTF
jgi:hypothetical protein